MYSPLKIALLMGEKRGGAPGLLRTMIVHDRDNSKMGVSIVLGDTPKWMVYFMEKPIEMDDLEVPRFQETSIYCICLNVNRPLYRLCCSHLAMAESSHSLHKQLRSFAVTFSGCLKMRSTPPRWYWKIGNMVIIHIITNHKLFGFLHFQTNPYLYWILV